MIGERPTDLLWVLLCTILVLFMQLGFLLLEAGAVRAKNTVNVAIKNLTDFSLSTLLYWAFGFSLMFGLPWTFLGSDSAASLETVVFFLFQAAFCGTAATIISGTVSERMSFRGYLLTTVIIAGLVYPVVGQWAWGSLAAGEAGWLEARGFVDFAGSTVVHSVGGWIALAAAIVIGPRRGRFDGQGHTIEGANLANSAGGALVLWIGWFGFNGGSALAFDGQVGQILLNTLLGGAAGGMTAVAFLVLRDRAVPPLNVANGIVGGLVGITAAASLASSTQAVILGAGGSIVAVAGVAVLERLHIDDAVGAIPTHLFAGIFGTLGVAFVAVDGTISTRFAAQAVGVTAIGVWSFGVGYLALRLLNTVLDLRVPAAAEVAGLNLAEHDSGSAMAELLDAMAAQQQSGDFSHHVPVRPAEEAGLIAMQYNRVLGRVEQEMAGREAMAVHLAEARDTAERASRAKSEFLAVMSHELRTPMNGVLGLSAVLAETDLDDRQAALVAEVRRSGANLSEVLDDVLVIAANETDKTSQVNRRMTLDSIRAAVETSHGAAAALKGLAFHVTCTDPPGLERVGDDASLARVLRHLIDNAIKFTDEGAVTVSLDGDPQTVVLTVSDTGAGMPKTRQGELVDAFVQHDSSATRRHGGAGLGLTVVHRLVAVMHGTVRIDSDNAQGTRIVVRVPCPLAALDIARRA